jgi:hypothetical protein
MVRPERRATTHQEVTVMVRSSFSVLLAATALLAAPVLRPSSHSPANAAAANLGRGEIVGEVVHTTGSGLKRRLQVRVDGQEWTLHVPGGTPITHARQPVSVHDIHIGTYVRAEGTRIGATRLKADRVFVIGDRLALARAGYPRSGYFARYAGYRTRFSRAHRRSYR